MKRDIKMMVAGALAGMFSGSFGALFGQVNGRGMALGLFLALGVVAVERHSAARLRMSHYPQRGKLLATALVTGVLAGLVGYHTVWVNKDVELFQNNPFIFSHLQFIGLITVYPLLMLPAYFSRRKILLTLAAGTLASIIIEAVRQIFQRGIKDVTWSNLPDILYVAAMTSIFMGFAFSLLWVTGMGLAGKTGKDH